VRISSVPLALKAEELLAGRFEIDTRPLTVISNSSVTVRVSFNRAFNSPPQVMVSFGGLPGVGTVKNLTAQGFDLEFHPSQGGGVGAFTYLAFGD